MATALKRLMGEESWSAVRALIAGRFVRVNGALVVDEARPVSPADVVEVFEHALPPPPGEAEVRVVHRDAHLIVVDKPAGIISVRRHEEREWDTGRKEIAPALDEVVARLARRGAGGAPAKVFDVHRLDRDTSGLMAFALSEPARAGLIKLFKKHEVDRRYLAVVHGHPAEIKIDSWLVRDRGDGLRGTVGGVRVTEVAAAPGAPKPPMTVRPRTPDAERAITYVKPIEAIGPYSIVECRLETGRTHQIRIHLLEAGFGLCGERTYTHALRGRGRNDQSGAPRQALHSATMAFVHPVTGEAMKFESGWPADLKGWVEGLRGTAAGGA